MLEAYVLVETRLGKAQEVAHRFEALDEVLHADIVSGCYDVVVRVRAESYEDLIEVVRSVRAVDGVTRALHCPVDHPVAEAHRGWVPLHVAV